MCSLDVVTVAGFFAHKFKSKLYVNTLNFHFFSNHGHTSFISMVSLADSSRQIERQLVSGDNIVIGGLQTLSLLKVQLQIHN